MSGREFGTSATARSAGPSRLSARAARRCSEARGPIAAPDGTDLTRWSVVGISTTAAASVTASGNRLDGMVISLASQRRSFVRGNTIRHVPLVRQYGINQRAAVTYKSAVPDYHEVEGNTVDAGVLPVYRHQPKGESR